MTQCLPEELEPAELLPAGTLLHKRYAIDGVLGRGTYGITYAARDERTGAHVALKEFFPYALVRRAERGSALMPKNSAGGALFFLGSEMFYRQHLALTDAKGSENLVSVHAAFFENGTSYAAMERLSGVTLERYLQVRRRRLYPEEAMYIAASLADALLVVHSLNSLHYDINARSIFLCTDGTVKLIDFGAAKAGLRARREVDDGEPWIDLSAIARTLYEAMTGIAIFGDGLQPHANIPPQFFSFLWQMTDLAGSRRVASVFDYRHALACVEIGARPLYVSEEDAANAAVVLQKTAAKNEGAAGVPARPSAFERVLEAMERVASEAQPDAEKARRELKFRKKIWLIYGAVAAASLILALVLRAVLH